VLSALSSCFVVSLPVLEGVTRDRVDDTGHGGCVTDVPATSVPPFLPIRFLRFQFSPVPMTHYYDFSAQFWSL